MAGKFECYRLLLPKLRQTYWIATDEHRYLVKFEADGLIGVLDTIRANKPGEMVEYHDDTLGFSMAAPAKWYFVKKEYEHRDADDPAGRNVHTVHESQMPRSRLPAGKPHTRLGRTCQRESMAPGRRSAAQDQ